MSDFARQPVNGISLSECSSIGFNGRHCPTACQPLFQIQENEITFQWATLPDSLSTRFLGCCLDCLLFQWATLPDSLSTSSCCHYIDLHSFNGRHCPTACQLFRAGNATKFGFNGRHCPTACQPYLQKEDVIMFQWATLPDSLSTN